jgi:hypothetical protein
MRRWWAKTLLICSLGLLLATRAALASEYYGQITFGGVAVPGATVTATRGDTTITVTSDERGLYRFADLSEGQWTIEISLQCFSSIRTDVTIAATNSPGKFELSLLPADKLKALATAPQPDTTVTPALQTTPQTQAAKTLAPNAPIEIPKPPSDANQQSSDGFLVNGSVNNAATSQYSLDRAFGNRRPNSKSLYNGGVSLVLDNSALDAQQYSLSGVGTPKPTYNRVTVGFTFGGPLRIPRLLPRGPNLFVAYQGTRNRNAQTDSALVPTEQERAGNLADAAGQPATIIDPTTGLPFPGNVVPISPQASALLQLYPQPNITGNALYNYQIPVLDSSHQDVVQTKVDKTLGRRDQLSGNLNLQSTRAGNVNLFGFVDDTDTLGMHSTITWAHRISQRLFFYATYRFSRLRTLVRPEYQNKQNIASDDGITGTDQTAAFWGPPALSFSSGLAPLSDAQSEFNRNRTDGFSGSVGIYHGKHNLTVGADLRKQQYNDFFEQDPRGAFTFDGAATGSDLADFLIGTPDTSSIAYGNADKYLRQTVMDGYATDDWRILPNLTINAGVRWEYGAPMTELHDRLVNLDVATGFAQVAPVLASDPVGALTGDHYPRSLIRPDLSGFEPRIGISLRPIPASTLVIRAGYGVYHDTSVYLNPVLQLAQQAPLSKSVKVQNSNTCPLTLANAFSPCATTTADTFAIDPHFRIGYAQTWRLSAQRDLPWALQMNATYLGVKGTHGVQQFLPNSYPLAGVNPCPSCPSGFVYQTSGGNSNRQAGQLQLRRRLRGGLMASLLYTYSKSIDDDSVIGGQGHATNSSSSSSSTSQNDESPLTTETAQSPAIAQDWLDLKAEQSLSSFDQRHLLNIQAQYTSGQGLEGHSLLGGWRGRILKEWTLLARSNIGTGMPETPLYSAPVPGTGVVGPLRPSLTGAPVASSQPGTHLNPAAYVAPAAGTWGNAPRYSITGPGQISFDSALQRTFRPGGRFFLDARIDSTNLLNHAVFSSWNTTVGSTQFGQPVSVDAMRSLQVTFRLRY